MQTLETLRGTNLTSLWGRRLGLQFDETLAGVRDVKRQVLDITSGSTATAVPAWGIVNAKMTTVATTASGGGFLLSNPIPGVPVDLVANVTSAGAPFGSTAISFQRATTNFYIVSSLGSTNIGVLLAQGNACRLMGMTTDQYMLQPLGTSAGVALTATS